MRGFHRIIMSFVSLIEVLDREPDLILLTETWNTTENIETFIMDGGYRGKHTCRLFRGEEGGGHVCILL